MSTIPICMLLLALLGVSLSQHHNDHDCYQCFHASSPHDCTTKVYCPHGQECFATHYTGPDGNTYYHLGCANHGMCTHSSSFEHHHTWHHPYTYEEVLCGHCCTEPGCNMKTCDPPSQSS